MDKIKQWDDLINRSVLINVNMKQFCGTFYIKNKRLMFSIDMTKDIEEWRKISENIDFLSGTFVEDARSITLLNCMYHGYSSTGTESIIKAEAIFIVDRVILDYQLKSIDDKFIKDFFVQYDDISWFISKKPYKNNFSKNRIEINNLHKEYLLNNRKIIFQSSPSFKENDYKLNVEIKNKILICNNLPITVKECIKEIYKLKNLLMLLGKRQVNVVTQKIYEDINTYSILDCGYDENYNKFNSDLLDHLNHLNGIKLDNLLNLNDIIDNFENYYDRLYPLIQLYFNVSKFKIPNLTRFVNSITMLEYYSREFDNSNAKKITQSKCILNGKKSRKQDADFVDMVESLIININRVYNLTSAEITKISENIKKSRTYYVHYEKKGLILTDDELMNYTYFIEDIILVNLYLLIGMKIEDFDNITFEGFYYEVKKIV